MSLFKVLAFSTAHIGAIFQATSCGTFEGQSDIATGWSPSISLIFCQCHSLNAAYHFSFVKNRIQ